MSKRRFHGKTKVTLVRKWIPIFAVFCFLGVVVGLSGCASAPPLEVQKQFELKRYLGKWYEIARLPNQYEKGCVCVTADYTLRKAGGINIFNHCIHENGKEKIVKGKAWPEDQTKPAQLTTQFFWPFKGAYHILYTNYQIAVVGTPSKNYLWLLSRRPHMSEADKVKLVSIAKQHGFAIERLHYLNAGLC